MDLGQSNPFANRPSISADSVLLMKQWQQFGLAAGPHEAKQMLRDLTNAAMAQAHESMKGRG